MKTPHRFIGGHEKIDGTVKDVEPHIRFVVWPTMGAGGVRPQLDRCDEPDKHAPWLDKPQAQFGFSRRLPMMEMRYERTGPDEFTFRGNMIDCPWCSDRRWAEIEADRKARDILASVDEVMGE